MSEIIPAIQFKYTQKVFDLLADTHHTDAPRPISILINNWGKKYPDDFDTLKRAAVGWAWENHKFGRQFQGLNNLNEIMKRQLSVVLQSETLLREIVGIEPQTLVSVEGSNQFIEYLCKAQLIPAKNLQDKGLYLSRNKIEQFLRENPPDALLNGSQYSTIDQALKKHSPELLLSLARNIDDPSWLSRQQNLIISAKPDELVLRSIIISAVSRNEFPALQHTMDAKIARGDKATGLVYFVTPSHESTQKPAALSVFTSRILHYLYEIHGFGTMFPKIFQRISGTPITDDKKTHLQAIFWKGMKKREDADSYFFGTHSLLEAIYWQKVYEQMSNIINNVKDSYLYKDNAGTDKLVKTRNSLGNDLVIGFHPMNLISQIFKGEARETVTTKRQVRLNLLMKLKGISNLDEAEQLLYSHLSDGFIDL